MYLESKEKKMISLNEDKTREKKKHKDTAFFPPWFFFFLLLFSFWGRSFFALPAAGSSKSELHCTTVLRSFLCIAVIVSALSFFFFFIGYLCDAAATSAALSPVVSSDAYR